MSNALNQQKYLNVNNASFLRIWKYSWVASTDKCQCNYKIKPLINFWPSSSYTYFTCSSVVRLFKWGLEGTTFWPEGRHEGLDIDRGVIVGRSAPLWMFAASVHLMAPIEEQGNPPRRPRALGFLKLWPYKNNQLSLGLGCALIRPQK